MRRQATRRLSNKEIAAKKKDALIFVADTAVWVYAAMVGAGGSDVPWSEPELAAEKLRELAAKAHFAAPFLAEALGIVTVIKGGGDA